MTTFKEFKESDTKNEKWHRENVATLKKHPEAQAARDFEKSAKDLYLAGKKDPEHDKAYQIAIKKPGNLAYVKAVNAYTKKFGHSTEL